MILERLPSRRRVHVLDIGSGQGDLAATLADARPDVEIAGIELSEVGVQIATAKVPRGRFRRVDLLDPAPPAEELAAWADVGVCAEVLEHLDDPTTFLKNARAYLRPGATLVVTVPKGPRSAYDKHIGHRRHYDVADLTTLLRGGGYEVSEVRAAGFPFFNVYKALVVLRGERLVRDAQFGADGETLVVRIAAAVFRGLFRCNTVRTPWGWQLVAVARVPD